MTLNPALATQFQVPSIKYYIVSLTSKGRDFIRTAYLKILKYLQAKNFSSSQQLMGTANCRSSKEKPYNLSGGSKTRSEGWKPE